MDTYSFDDTRCFNASKQQGSFLEQPFLSTDVSEMFRERTVTKARISLNTTSTKSCLLTICEVINITATNITVNDSVEE